MRKYKYPGCLFEILIAIILIGLGFVSRGKIFDIKQIWVKILLVIIIVSLGKTRDWINPYKRFEKKLNKAKRAKDKSQTRRLLNEALSIEEVSEKEKSIYIDEIAKIYSKIGEYEKSIDYYNKAIEILKKDLESTLLSEMERIETLGRIGVYLFEIKNYSHAAYYLDKAINIGLNNKKFFLHSDALIYVMKIYIANNQKHKAERYYNIFLQRKKCKRNKGIEELLRSDKTGILK